MNVQPFYTLRDASGVSCDTKCHSNNTVYGRPARGRLTRVIKCEVCSIKSVFKCAGCGCSYYCSKEHQKRDWKRHKRFCKIHYNKTHRQLRSPSSSLSSSSSDSMSRLQNHTFGPDDCFINAKNLTCYEELVSFVHKALYKTGLCVIDNYVHANIAAGVTEETINLYQTPGTFRAADRMNTNKEHTNSHVYRSDEVTWITGKEQHCKYIEKLCKTFDNLVSSLELERSPTHKSNIQVSCFPNNTMGYVSHIDNPSDNGRLLTTVYHCNRNYERELHGGVSRYYFLNGKFVDVEPQFNRAVIHWSDRRIFHETLQCREQIFSLTSWYLDFSVPTKKEMSCCGDTFHMKGSCYVSNNTKYSQSPVLSLQNRPCENTKIVFSTYSTNSTSVSALSDEKRILYEKKHDLVEDLMKMKRLTSYKPTEHVPYFNSSVYPVLTQV